jgi:uncharacterized phage protein (TIGR02220 family)
MAKRLTDTEKWDDPWFRSLSPVMKCIWIFLCDRCDNAGVWKKDFEIMQFFIGQPIEPDKALAVFNDNKKRIVPIGEDKWLICKFAIFQYSNNPKMYKHINDLCVKHGLDIDTLFIGYQYPIDRAKDKDKVKVKDEGVVRGNKADYDLSWPISYLNSLLGTRYSTTIRSNLDVVKARYSEGRTQDDFKTVIDKKVAQWRSDEKMSKYLRPETLFNRTKFESYLNEPTTKVDDNGVPLEFRTKDNLVRR